jgi:hypothetical protein
MSVIELEQRFVMKYLRKSKTKSDALFHVFLQVYGADTYDGHFVKLSIHEMKLD